jgi:hypothetical protein
MRDITFTERLDNTLQEDYGMYLHYFKGFQEVVTHLENNYPKDDVEDLVELIRANSLKNGA